MIFWIIEVLNVSLEDIFASTSKWRDQSTWRLSSAHPVL